MGENAYAPPGGAESAVRFRGASEPSSPSTRSGWAARTSPPPAERTGRPWWQPAGRRRDRLGAAGEQDDAADEQDGHRAAAHQ
ncbi:hypothetical protein, partial [Nocardiopsis protaetiae]|uniref:hypothetical protein n=1 Tax=Nocardiopsis protaetiae TaxID=3382270 RepID=UPI00387AD771